MPTTSQGIYYPDSTTNVAPLHTVFSTMASSIDDILAGDVQIHRVANTTARNALVSQFPPSTANPLFVWRADATNGQELEYTKNGSTWYYVSTSEDDTGWVNIPLINGWSAVSGLTPQVRRIGRQVRIRGRVSGGSGVIAMLDSQFRPDAQHQSAIRDGSGNNLGVVIVLASGSLSASGAQPNIDTGWFTA